MTITGKPAPLILGMNSYINKGYLYLLFGLNADNYTYMHEVLRLDLSGSVYQWEYLNNDPLVARTIKYYYSCAGSELDNKLYIFGGVSLAGHENNLILVDLADNLPVLSELSTTKNVPTARVGHAMEAHSGSLFIFGGKKYDGSR